MAEFRSRQRRLNLLGQAIEFIEGQHRIFGGSDQLSAPVGFTFSQPSQTPEHRSHRREPGSDVRIVSFNTYFEGLSDPDRAEAMARLLNSVDGNIYCFQEEWKTEGHSEILKRLMPLEGKSRWHIHKVQVNVTSPTRSY